jgi:Kunitz/Bovine pancreatic trypsin inhibitor domain
MHHLQTLYKICQRLAFYAWASLMKTVIKEFLILSSLCHIIYFSAIITSYIVLRCLNYTSQYYGDLNIHIKIKASGIHFNITPSNTLLHKYFVPRWGYNGETQKCEDFNYGGCKGNMVSAFKRTFLIWTLMFWQNKLECFSADVLFSG